MCTDTANRDHPIKSDYQLTLGLPDGCEIIWILPTKQQIFQKPISLILSPNVRERMLFNYFFCFISPDKSIKIPKIRLFAPDNIKIRSPDQK